MTAVSKTHTFVAGTAIESAQANQNFDDLVNYTNNEVIVRDATKAFTAIPSGPATDPTTANQLTRKQYVDNADNLRVKIDGSTAFTGIPSGPATNPTTANQFTRKQYVDDSAVTPLTFRPSMAATGQIIKVGDAVVSADANGQAYVPFASPFPTAVTTVVVTSGDNGAGTQFISVNGGGQRTVSGFGVTCYGQTVVAGPFGGFVLERTSGSVRVSYIAFGY